MTDSTTTQPAASRVPTHIAYQVRDLENGKSFWTRIGRAWTNADGKGFNIQLETIPLDGFITVRVPTAKAK